MDLLQSLAGRATDAVGRLAASMNGKTALPTDLSAGAPTDFAAAFAMALNPGEAAAAPTGGMALLAGLVDGETDVSSEVTAELAAAGETADAAAPGAVVDPTSVQRGLDLVDPEFRARLERVIDRMQDEFGHSVKITETFRTQERQNHLYEQGRSRPGPVVTWTRASNHTLGRAADVIIDGSYGNPLAYERLGQIAAEEGLRTLGPRDAGHIELPGSGSGSAVRFASATPGLLEPEAAAGKPAWEPQLELEPSRGGMARVAQVARVADVAQVAEVARVATVAAPGAAPGAAPMASGSPAAAVQTHAFRGERGTVAVTAASFGPGVQAQAFRTDRGAVASSRTAEAVQALHQAMGNHQGIAALRSELLGQAFSEGEGGSADGESAPGWQPELISPESSFTRAPFQSAVSEILATSGTSAAERVARVMELQEGGETGAMSSVLLRVENAAGGEDRIRVDLRGNGVEATIDMKNVGEAERLGNRLGDLQRTLERHGLESETLRVRTTPTAAADVAEVARVGIAVGDTGEARGSRTGAGGSGSESFRETWKESTQGQSRRDPADPRNRDRRFQQPEKESA